MMLEAPVKMLIEQPFLAVEGNSKKEPAAAAAEVVAAVAAADVTASFAAVAGPSSFLVMAPSASVVAAAASAVVAAAVVEFSKETAAVFAPQRQKLQED